MKIVEDILKGILLISVIAVGVLFFYQKSLLKDSGSGDFVDTKNIEVDPFSGTEIRKPGKEPLLFPDFTESILHIYSDPENEDILWIAAPGGLMQYDIAKRDIKNLFDANNGLMRPRNMVRAGDNLFVSNQGGFQKLSLEGSLLAEYTVEDGLVNGSNLHLVHDPRDKNILWIGTFDGLSKFNIETEEFINFDNISIPFVSKLGINSNVSVGDRYVWIAVNANAYSGGGIARLDKDTGIWKSWGKNTFNESNRIDFNSIQAVGNSAFAITNDEIFAYNPATDQWNILDGNISRIFDKFSVGNDMYFIDKEGLKYTGLDNGEIEELVTVEDVHDIEYADSINTIIIFKETDDGGRITLYDIGLNKITDEFSFSLPLEYQFNSAVFSNNDFMLLTRQQSYQHPVEVYAYFFDKEELVFLDGVEPSRASRSESRVYELKNGNIVFASLPICELGCSEGTVFILSPDNFEVLDSYTVAENLYQDIIMDYSNERLFFIARFASDTDVKEGVFVYDEQKNAFNPTELTIDEIKAIPGAFMQFRIPREPSKYIANSKDGRYAMEVDSRVEGNDLIIRYKKSEEGDFKEKNIGVKKPKYNPFGWEPDVSITNIRFSDTQPGVVWIGTNRGLVNFDLNTEKSFIFETTGLPESFVIYAGEKLILADDLGIYVYYK